MNGVLAIFGCIAAARRRRSVTRSQIERIFAADLGCRPPRRRRTPL